MLPSIRKEEAFTTGTALRLDQGAILQEGPNADHEGFVVREDGVTVHVLKEEHMSEWGKRGRENGFTPVLVDLSGEDDSAKAQILWIVNPPTAVSGSKAGNE